MRSVWFIETGQSIPRLVSACPDRVILTDSLPEHHLVAGDIGTVVLIHGDHGGYEVKFVTLNGETVAVTSVRADQLRPVGRELAHARAMSDQRTPARHRLRIFALDAQNLTIDLDVLFGKPVVRGTRIMVGHILKKLAAGKSIQDVIAVLTLGGFALPSRSAETPHRP